MAIVQVKDATGSLLDWMVAKCEGTPSVRMFENSKGFRVYKNESMKMQGINFAPSTVWAQGGSIIEREKIATSPLTDGTWNAYVANGTRWVPRNQSGVEVYNWEFKQTGSTLLIAAMRCYVSSVLGDQVEVPDELI